MEQQVQVAAPTVVGRVKWFDERRGFGFVTPDDGSEDVLLHCTALKELGIKSVEQGAAIECIAMRRQRGLQATKVLSISGSNPDSRAKRLAERLSIEPADLSAALYQSGLRLEESVG